MYIEVVLNSTLLLFWQVVVCHVWTADIIFLDDIFPRGLGTSVGKIEVFNVVVLQSCILLGGVTESLTARPAP